MRRTWAMATLLMACGPTVAVEDSEGAGTGSTGTTTTDPPPPPTSTDTGVLTGTATIGPPPDTTDTGLDSSTGIAFIRDPDGGGVCFGCCDLFAQDCPQGEKCIPWDPSPDSAYGSVRCSPVVRDPAAPGEPCTMMGGPTSGQDDCDETSMCFGVDPDTLEGTCVSFCRGDEIDPGCPAGLDCLVSDAYALALCLPPCDPLGAGCGEGELCAPSANGFVCVPAFVDPLAGVSEGCIGNLGCQAGLVCHAYSGLGAPCDMANYRCCTEICDLSTPEPAAICSDPDHGCQPLWRAPLSPPSGYENVGYCAVT